MRFNPSLDGKFLDGHVIESSQEIMTKDGCELECFMNADCVSYNFGTNLTAGEKRGTVCELIYTLAMLKIELDLVIHQLR